MSERKLGFGATVKSLPRAAWIANTMEIFERMAWYGFFAVSSLYITGPVETGGLGFTSEDRGLLQAIVPFFLYLFPVITGALADRYGYKKMFIIAYVGMVISYYALGQFKTFPTFLGAFMLVAVAAAIFKPVVVGTIARVTDERNSALGFAIFYMMVNIGGFLGPLVAGAVRGVSWDLVFLACSGWALINLIIVMIFYRDPSTESQSASPRTLQQVLDDTVEVLGNLRFFIAAFVPLLAVVLAGFEFEWFQFWPHFVIFLPVWIALNFVWDAFLPRDSGRPVSRGGERRFPFFKRMHCSNWRFALFLLIMSGFWTSFQQIFITMPEYVRDYTDTKAMVNAGRSVFGAVGKPEWINGLAAIEDTELLQRFDSLVRRAHGVSGMVPNDASGAEIRQSLLDIKSALSNLRKKKRELSEDDLQAIDRSIAALKEARDKAPEEMRPVIDDAGGVHSRIDRALNIKNLPNDPALTESVVAELTQSAASLNAPSAQRPLEVVDLVEGARALLSYKVRIQPLELAELIAQVPDCIAEVSEEDLATAQKTIVKRLKLLKEPELNDEEATLLKAELRKLVIDHGPLVPMDAVVSACEALSVDGRVMKPKTLALGVRDLAYRPTIWAEMKANRQVNPEHIVNIDALSIVCLQVLIATIMARFHRFTTMIVGMLIAAAGLALPALAGGTMIGPLGGLLSVVILGIVMFAIGEMMASPTSQEYVGRIAPQDKKALYMGYYFVAIALGNLFSGVISGQLYGKLARDMHRPDLMWLAFGGIMFATAVVFMLYNRFALPKHASDSLTANRAGA